MYRLQWGHAFVSVETENMLGLQIMPDELQWGHAFVSVETRCSLILVIATAELQWGHAFVSVETVCRASRRVQRGRFNGATLL